MGAAEKKRKIRKLNERKFVFDWNAEEDTSKDYDPLYNNRHEALMFGRGVIAGIDVKEQKKQRSAFYDDLLEKRRTEEEKSRIKWVRATRETFLFNRPSPSIFLSGKWRTWKRKRRNRLLGTTGTGRTNR